uniref:Uncharacterized protein n=1 Tax=Arundo donax TaxID=35708 RepID=A0A0A9CQY8_ARUDO
MGSRRKHPRLRRGSEAGQRSATTLPPHRIGRRTRARDGCKFLFPGVEDEEAGGGGVGKISLSKQGEECFGRRGVGASEGSRARAEARYFRATAPGFATGVRDYLRAWDPSWAF